MGKGKTNVAICDVNRSIAEVSTSGGEAEENEFNDEKTETTPRCLTTH